MELLIKKKDNTIEENKTLEDESSKAIGKEYIESNESKAIETEKLEPKESSKEEAKMKSNGSSNIIKNTKSDDISKAIDVEN